MAKNKLGSGWDREADGKKYVSVVLDLGFLGEISLALFENGKRDAARNQPTHNLVYTPKGGKTKYVGAFWKKEGKNGGEYLLGRIEPKELGQVEQEGVPLDFSKYARPIPAKLCRAAESNGKGPHYHLFRVEPTPTPKAATEEE